MLPPEVLRSLPHAVDVEAGATGGAARRPPVLHDEVLVLPVLRAEPERQAAGGTQVAR